MEQALKLHEEWKIPAKALLRPSLRHDVSKDVVQKSRRTDAEVEAAFRRFGQ
jgi:hypothetical protein